MNLPTNTNYIKYNGILVGTRSYNNISLDILRSGITKYILLNNFDKAIWCAIELYLFKLESISAIRTNLINKLFLIYINHIGLNNINLLLIMDNLLTQLESSNLDDKKLCEIIKLLCSCKQDNLVLVISHVFSYITYKNINENNDLLKFQIEMGDTSDINNYNLGDYWIYKKDKDPDDLINYMDYLIYYIDINSEKALYWLYKIHELTKKKVKAAKRLRRFKPIYAVWEHLFERANNENDTDFPIIKYIKTCYKYYIKINESIDILVMAILLFIKKINYSPITEIKFTDEAVSDIFNRNLNNNIIEFDGYCFDKNVKEGRNLTHIKKNQNEIELLDMENIPDRYQNLYKITDKPMKIKKKDSRKKVKQPTIELVEDIIPGDCNLDKEIVHDKTKDIIHFMET